MIKKEVKDWAADVGIVFTRVVLRLCCPVVRSRKGEELEEPVLQS